MAIGDRSLEAGELAAEHGAPWIDAGKFEIDDQLGSNVLVDCVGAFQLRKQQEGIRCGDRKDYRALGRVMREAGRVDYVVIGIEKQQIDAVGCHPFADFGLDFGIEVRAETL